MNHQRPRIALFVDRMSDGGVQRSFLALAEVFSERGCDVDLVVGDGLGEHHQAIPPAVRMVTLTSGSRTGRVLDEVSGRWTGWRVGDLGTAGKLRQRWRSFLPSLTRYLATVRPNALLAAKTLANIVALLAKKRAGVATRIVVSERTHLSESMSRSRYPWKADLLPGLIRDLYPDASGIVAISRHVALDLALTGQLPKDSTTTIHNGLLRPEALDLPASDHPWFAENTPVLLGVGRLSREKDFATLIKAFALVRRHRPVRLMIVGEGRERSALESLIQDLGLQEDVLLPGFSDNPYAFMKAASLFIMSSTHEGFGNVLIEALAAGCPVMSTNCPGGPPEILEGGRIGALVPVGDEEAMADGIERMLDDPPERSLLVNRAADFSMDRVADAYLACLLPAMSDDIRAAS